MHWIAARYEVEPRQSKTNSVQHSRALDLTSGFSRNDGMIGDDYKAIAGLGFRGIVLYHVEDDEPRTLLDLADEVGLKAAIPDRSFNKFVMNGELPPLCRDVDDLLHEAPDEIVRHPALHGYILEGGRDAAARERSQKLCAQLIRNGTTCFLQGDDEGVPLVIIDARIIREGPPGTALERLLAEYHSALCSGKTGGVIVDRFTRRPGDPPGLTSADEPLLPAHHSALSAMIQRARCWGPKLSALPMSSLISTTDSSWLTVTLFGQEARRYVLVFNTSSERFAREEVRLSASILNRPVLRAVEVPPSMDRGAGRVIHVQRGQLPLPVELRPGDAALFEIF